MDNNDVSCEPMDIDLSNQSVRDMDISYDVSDESDSIYEKALPRLSSRTSISPTPDQPSDQYSAPNEHTVVKKYHINIQKSSRGAKNRILKVVAAIMTIFVSIIIYNVYGLKCCEELNIEIINETMSNNLFGQPAAVDLIMQALALKTRSKIIFFSGGTGVGKTFASSLLLESIGSYSNVYHYTMPTFENTFSPDQMFELTLCKISLIIVDDLTLNDKNIKTHIQNVIKKSESLGKEITVILIYNCNEDHISFDNGCDESFNSKLLNNFSDLKVLKRVIRFEPLSESHLKECIKQELGNRELNDLEFGNLLKNFNVSVDGCKGVHSKMKYLNIV